MNKVKQNIIVIVTVLITSVAGATNYTSTGNGSWTTVGMPGSATYLWGGADTLFINNAVTTSGNYTIGTGSGTVLYIKSGASLTINGDFTFDGSGLVVYIENGGLFDVVGGFKVVNTNPDIDVLGILRIGAGMSNVNGSLYIGPSGFLDVTGDYLADASGTITIDGDASFTGNFEMYNGTLTVNSTGELAALGSTVTVGAANFTNNGRMNYPNVTTVSKWGGTFDCDGSGSGVVDFGQNVTCSAICSGSTGSGTAGCYSNGSAPLPIKLKYFSVKEVNGQVAFDWATLMEDQNDYFSIEYSYDAAHFMPLIDWVQGAGNSTKENHYQAQSTLPFEQDVVYFRLRQTDYNGETSISTIEALLLTNSSNTGVFVYPNPASDLVSIQITDHSKEYNAYLVNPIGMTKSDTFVIKDGVTTVSVDDLPEGVYFLYVTDYSDLPKKVIIQH